MEGHQANGVFVACGPPGFTALALIKLGSQARKMFLVIFSHLFSSKVLTLNDVYSIL